MQTGRRINSETDTCACGEGKFEAEWSEHFCRGDDVTRALLHFGLRM